MNKVTKFYYKFQINSWFQGLKDKFSMFLDNDKPRCFVFLAADYGNLGDVAITYAQEVLLAEKYPNHQIVDIPISSTLSVLPFIKKHVKSGDVITITGGGNMSDMYFDIELCRLLVVKAFPNNKVIIFPQSIIMSESKDAKILIAKMTKIYTAHKNLIIFAREKVSYKKMKSLWPSVNVALTPDVVMTFNPGVSFTVRKGITLCLREDKEMCGSQELKALPALLKENYEVYKYDTHIGHGGLSMQDRKDELTKIWNQFAKSEWVITDRLHGMIFAFITCTPAIVISNNNHKIVGCYEWIRNCGYIHFVKNIDNNEILKLIALKSFTSKFNVLNEELKTKMLIKI